MASKRKEMAYIVMIALLGTLFSCVFVAEKSSAVGWYSASFTKPTSYEEFYPGQSMTIIISGIDGDNDKNDNYIDVVITRWGSSTSLQEWNHQYPSGGNTWTETFVIPSTASLGYYDIDVYDNSTGVRSSWTIGSRTIRLVSPSSFWNIHIEDSIYTHSDTFVPTETMKYTIRGPADTEFKLQVKQQDTLWKDFGTLRTDGGGYLNVTWDNPGIPADAPDAVYTVYIYQAGTDTVLDSEDFVISLYRLEIGLERNYFIIGEKVIVRYRATNYKDGTVVTSGSGVWKAFNNMNVQIASGTVTSALGSFSFDVPTSAQPSSYYRVEMWFNDSHDAGSKRHAFDSDYFEVGNLECDVSTDSISYLPGGVVRVTITTFTGSFSDYIPGVTVNNIVVSSKPSGSSSWTVVPEYGAMGLVTDEFGKAYYIFRLKEDVADKTEFKVEVNVTKLTSVSDSTIFIVNKGASSLTISVRVDKDIYTCGDTVKVTVDSTIPTGMTLTYHYTIIKGDPYSNDYLDLNVSNMNTYSFVIPNDYIGNIYISVRAITNTDGLTATDYVTIDVVYGKMIVNTDKETFKPKDTVTITYKLISNLMNSPKFYYRVYSGSAFILEKDISSTSKSGSFTFKIPDVPMDSYIFYVYANENGRTVWGSEVISQLTGYLLVTSLDKRAAAPGETVTVSYSLIPQGTTPKINSIASITVGLLGSSKMVDVNTVNKEGKITYVLPNDITEGSKLMSIYAVVDEEYYYSYIILDIDKNPSLKNVPAGDVAALAIGSIGLGIGFIALLFAFMILRKLKSMNSTQHYIYENHSIPRAEHSQAQGAPQQPQGQSAQHSQAQGAPQQPQG